ncbi:MAG: sensor histidine kinase [Chitinophagaceae bacterium]|nr:sensor histidine kinase [Chitinophagaceae bacterium]
MLIAAAIVLFIIITLGYRNYRQKQKMHAQQINELEIEKKLTATEAVLKGEEQERTRLAKDLHDGLGGMLSGIKYTFQSLQGKDLQSSENQQSLSRGMEMLDQSIHEMRRLAHNMMPEVLLRYGLNTAISELCQQINKTGAIKLTYDSIGIEGMEIPQTTSITIFRIVQELLNNILKHSGASTAYVQLGKNENHLSITVEDDGKGFNTDTLINAQGIGWSNIQNRVEFLKGKLHVSSSEGKGCSVLIEFSL